VDGDLEGDAGRRARQAKFQALQTRPQRIEEERATPRWTWALRTVVAAGEREIELQGLHVHQMDGAAGACELRIDGVTAGPHAAAVADSFRRKIEQGLQLAQPGAPVKTGFLRFSDTAASPAAPANQQGIMFEVVATVGVEDPSIFKRVLKF